MLYKADLILHSRTLKYLSILQRYGDAALTYESKIMKMNVDFAFKFLQVTQNNLKRRIFFNFNFLKQDKKHLNKTAF
jgi:hypothetical protein